MESSASSSSLVDSCLQICLRFQDALDQGSLLILHRSKWQCLVHTYSHVLQALVRRIDHTSSTNLGREVLCQRLSGSLQVVFHAMQEAERCFRRCMCPISNINHSWLVGNALKLATSMDVVEIHLHDFIWSYAIVLEQAFWLRICFIHANFDSLKQETLVLHELWAAEDTRGDLREARKQILNTIECEEEDETSQLANFIVRKLTSLNEDVEAHHIVLPDYLWVDAKGLRIKPDFCIGSGGFGVVHEATWLGGRFAVKDIPYYGEEAFTERERAIQARLHHPNVMSLICCTKNTASERLGIVMEFMEQDLRHMLQKRKREGKDPPCTLLEAVDLMLQIANGMEYLHSLNVIHRDLKSSNILVSVPYISSTQSRHHTHLKIADFGMAKAKQMSSYFTTKPAGTLAWRAPEVFQVEGMDNCAARYSKKADVYSFGLVCYEILTGELPFIEVQQLYRRVMEGERPQLPSYCPGALASFIQRCWDGNPIKRPGFACICSLLRYFKARILLGNLNNHPSVAQKWLAHPLSTDNTIAHITDMLQSQDRSLVTALPVNILLEMYQCRLVSQESSELCEDDGEGGDSDHTTCCGRSRWKRLFKRRFLKSQQVFETGNESIQQAPLPGIDGLRISGHAMVGELVLAMGISINGTTVCCFQWFRHHRDGTSDSIPGAHAPDYTITVDDLNTFLSVEVVPLDDTKRKGVMVEAFLEDRKWIS